MSPGGDLLRHDAELRQDHAAEAADAELEPSEVVDRVDLLAVPAAHLHADIAAPERHDVVLPEHLAQQLEPAAVVQPGVLLARVEAEGEARIEGEGRVLADEERGQRVAALDGAGLHRVEHLQRRHDLAGGDGADGERPRSARRRAGRRLRRAVHRVQALRPAGLQAPAQLAASGPRWPGLPPSAAPHRLGQKSRLFISSSVEIIAAQCPFDLRSHVLACLLHVDRRPVSRNAVTCCGNRDHQRHHQQLQSDPGQRAPIDVLARAPAAARCRAGRTARSRTAGA